TINYTITVNNTGPGSASNVTLTDPTPAGLTFVSASGSGCVAFPCSLGTITSGQSKSVQATYTVSNIASPIVNTASVTSSTPDPTSSNNTVSFTTSASCPASAPHIVSPADGQSNVATTMTLVWSSTSASAYNVYLDSTANGCSRLIATTTSSSLPVGGLTAGATYHWRVEGLSPGCQTRSSICATF